MTPADVSLALRAVAAGAPVPITFHSGDGRRVSRNGFPLVRDPAGIWWFEHRAYRENPQTPHSQDDLVPLLSDPSWLGWTLAEVERRGYWWALSARGAWSVTGPSQAGGDPCDRPAALVAMLEATCPKS